MIIPPLEHQKYRTSAAVMLALAYRDQKSYDSAVAGRDKIRSKVEAVKEGQRHTEIKLTNQALCYRFLVDHGFSPSHGRELSDGELAPIVPYFIADASYNFYTKFILPLPLKFDLKKARNTWRDHYLEFSKELRSPFSVDEYDQITDLMDEYETALAHDLEIAHYAAMAVLPDDLSTQDEQILAACLMANKLAKIADDIYGTVFKSGLHYKSASDERKRNGSLDGIIIASRDFSKCWLSKTGREGLELKEKNIGRLETSLTIVMKHTIAWLKGQGGAVK